MGWGWIIAGTFAAALVVLFVFNPAGNSFYPQCGFRKLTGLDCPGCGGLRAVHQLLHGQVAAAFALNPLFCLLTPPGGLLLARAAWRRAVRGGEFRLGWRPAWTWALGAVAIAFWILRNISAIQLLANS